MLKAIIVEDEAPLRLLIQKFILEIDSQINIIEECDNILDAEEVIRATKPDIVFLDIILPGGTGLVLLHKLPMLTSEIIFITAYDKYVMDAFKYAAVGYILKPIDKKELKVAIENAKRRIYEKKGNNIDILLEYIKVKPENDNIQKIGVPTVDGITFVNCNDIIHCEGTNSYTKIFLKDNTHLVSAYNLAKFKTILPKDIFCQVHKSHIISLSFVNKYNSKDAIVEMVNGNNVPVSKKQKTDFIMHFKMPKH